MRDILAVALFTSKFIYHPIWVWIDLSRVQCNLHYRSAAKQQAENPSVFPGYQYRCHSKQIFKNTSDFILIRDFFLAGCYDTRSWYVYIFTEETWRWKQQIHPGPTTSVRFVREICHDTRLESHETLHYRWGTNLIFNNYTVVASWNFFTPLEYYDKILKSRCNNQVFPESVPPPLEIAFCWCYFQGVGAQEYIC